MLSKEVTEIVFNEENWFELYYRLGFAWGKDDRELGAPDGIILRAPGFAARKNYPRGSVFVFRGVELLEVR